MISAEFYRVEMLSGEGLLSQRDERIFHQSFLRAMVSSIVLQLRTLLLAVLGALLLL